MQHDKRSLQRDQKTRYDTTKTHHTTAARTHLTPLRRIKRQQRRSTTLLKHISAQQTALKDGKTDCNATKHHHHHLHARYVVAL